MGREGGCREAEKHRSRVNVITIGICDLHGLKVQSDLTNIIAQLVYLPLAVPRHRVFPGISGVPASVVSYIFIIMSLH